MRVTTIAFDGGTRTPGAMRSAATAAAVTVQSGEIVNPGNSQRQLLTEAPELGASQGLILRINDDFVVDIIDGRLEQGGLLTEEWKGRNKKWAYLTPTKQFKQDFFSTIVFSGFYATALPIEMNHYVTHDNNEHHIERQ